MHCSELLNLCSEWQARLVMVFPGEKELQWAAGRRMLASIQLLFVTLSGGAHEEADDEAVTRELRGFELAVVRCDSLDGRRGSLGRPRVSMIDPLGASRPAMLSVT